MEYLKTSQYIRARLAFQTLINLYPDSKRAADAYFAMGDSFYDEGGTENLLQAWDCYRNAIYASKGNYAAAIPRLKRIIDNYPNFSHYAEAKQLYEASQQYQQASPK